MYIFELYISICICMIFNFLMFKLSFIILNRDFNLFNIYVLENIGYKISYDFGFC